VRAGLTRAERERLEQERALAARRLEGLRRQRPPDDDPDRSR
jgi:hypothetical protein